MNMNPQYAISDPSFQNMAGNNDKYLLLVTEFSDPDFLFILQKNSHPIAQFTS